MTSTLKYTLSLPLVLFVRSELLSPAYNQREGISLYLLKA